MGKARLLGQYHPFVPNRYADIRRRPVAVLNRRDRLERQHEELEAAKIQKELENWKIQVESQEGLTEKKREAMRELDKLLKYMEDL